RAAADVEHVGAVAAVHHQWRVVGQAVPAVGHAQDVERVVPAAAVDLHVPDAVVETDHTRPRPADGPVANGPGRAGGVVLIVHVQGIKFGVGGGAAGDGHRAAQQVGQVVGIGTEPNGVGTAAGVDGHGDDRPDALEVHFVAAAIGVNANLG